MVRSYLRHGCTEVFGLIASNTSNSLFDGRRAYVPALEDVFVWDAKRGEQVGMWHATGHTAPVTSISRSPIDPDKFAVGYQDGSIRIWSAKSKKATSLFEGHRRAISCLAWDEDGSRLASGGLEGEVILWDILAETGLFRLRGHNNRITGLAFVCAPTVPIDPSSSNALPPPQTHLLTTSQDTYLKLWDLQTQHSIESVVAHRSESWSVTVVPQTTLQLPSDALDDATQPEILVITTGGEGEVKLWALKVNSLAHGPQRRDDGQGFVRAITCVGNLALGTPGAHGKRVLGAVVHPYSLKGGVKGTAIAFQVGDRVVELWRIRTIEEVKKKKARRRKREMSKSKRPGAVPASAEAEQAITWLDCLSPWIMLRGSSKVVSFSFPPTSNSRLIPSADKPSELQVLLALSNNSVEVLAVPKPTTSRKAWELEASLQSAVTLPGHRNDIRTISISFDDQLVASGSNGCLKIWNIKTQKCIRTMACGYALCAIWLPGNRHVLVGTKTGQLMLYELSSSSLLESRDAHTGPIWSLHLRPDGKSIVTGSADKSVKFWNLSTKAVQTSPEKESACAVAPNDPDVTLTLTHAKTMKMQDDILAVCYSPDSKLLAVSSLDCTVKVFFQDTLKFFLSLYGHKLPILGMDISSDSKLLVTCSADKNVKIWGLDFGDCHKSIFAHEESVMQVAFETNSHYFWTVGRDGLVKYWDGDKFENIQTLKGHHKEVSALSVSNNNQFVVTGSFDKSIRIWEKTDEPLFIEEERENELEEIYRLEETAQADSMAMRQRQVKESGCDQGEGDEEAGAVSKQTNETLTFGERVMEALTLAAADLESLKKYRVAKALMQDRSAADKIAPPVRDPTFAALNNISAHAYVLKVIQSVPRPALEDALLVLPFTQVIMLLNHVEFWVEQGWIVSLVCRVLFFLLRTYEAQITATTSLKVTMDSIKTKLDRTLRKQKDIVAYNSEAIKFLKQGIDLQQKEKQFFDLDLRPEDEVRAMSSQTKKRKVVL